MFLLAPDHARAGASETQISFALVMQGAEPVTGTATCKTGQKCELVTGNPNLRLAVTAKNSGTIGTLSIDCTPSCSFVSGHSSFDIKEENLQPIEIYAGEQLGLETQLVVRPRRLIGRLMVILHKC